METGDIKMHYEKFDVVELTQEVFEQLEDKALAKKMRLKFEKQYDKPISQLHADRQRISQVMINPGQRH